MRGYKAPSLHLQTIRTGVSIAFWAMGDGMPLVHMPVLPFSHIQLEWQMPEIRRWYQGLALNRKHVRYDGRGSGLSDRDVGDYSLYALLLDLAVQGRRQQQRQEPGRGGGKREDGLTHRAASLSLASSRPPSPRTSLPASVSARGWSRSEAASLVK